MIRVLIAHQQELIANALATFLAGADDVEVVGIVRTGAEATHTIGRSAPDVVVAGTLPDVRSGAAPTLSPADRQPAVLLVAGEQSAPEVFEAIDAGVSGFITTACSVDQLVDAVRRVAKGEVVVFGIEARRMAGAARAPERPAERTTVAEADLTPREREILNGICAGKSNRQIAEQLFISAHTVRTHVQNIRSKLKVNSKLEAALAVVGPGAEPVAAEPEAPEAPVYLRPALMAR